jgi:hypothetical protein
LLLGLHLKTQKKTNQNKCKEKGKGGGATQQNGLLSV